MRGFGLQPTFSDLCAAYLRHKIRNQVVHQDVTMYTTPAAKPHLSTHSQRQVSPVNTQEQFLSFVELLEVEVDLGLLSNIPLDALQVLCELYALQVGNVENTSSQRYAPIRGWAAEHKPSLIAAGYLFQGLLPCTWKAKLAKQTTRLAARVLHQAL